MIPGYIVAIVLTVLSDEEFVNIAWDSAGVTTGPVTVPLVLAMGLGFGNALNAIEGFGILSGYGEAGEEGRIAERELVALADRRQRCIVTRLSEALREELERRVANAPPTR